MITADTISSEEIVINAPAQFVWDILVDFTNYGQWNEFCPEIKGEAEMGCALHMMVDLGNGPQLQIETITRLEPPHAVTWSMENKPGDPIHADRTQTVTPVDETSCTYVSYDVFSGEAVPMMMEAMGEPVEKGFNLCGTCLKRWAESQYQKQA